MTVRALRFVVAFGRFWWDFLIGDTPELFVGAVVAVSLVALLCTDHAARSIAAGVFPVLVAALIGVSVWKAARRA